MTRFVCLLLVLLGAAKGDERAQYAFGVMYDNGRGVATDDVEAVRWYRLAAKQGHASAQADLGVMHEAGSGVEKDAARAVEWYTLAADQGLARAQYNLGILYGNGHGVPQDNRQAFLWCAIAAERVPASGTETRDRVVRDRDLFAARLTPGQLAESQRLARAWEPQAEGGN